MTQMSRDTEIIERYEGDLMSGKVFRNHSRSAGSIIGYQPPTGHSRWAKALAILAKGAALDDRQASLIAYIIGAGGLPLHMQAGDLVKQMFDRAATALEKGYFDTVKNASPEPGRYSDNQHEYNLRDRLTLLHTLTHASRCFIPSGTDTPGWCWSALIEREKSNGHIWLIHV